MTAVSHPSHPWHVAIIANVKGVTQVPSDAPDADAEFDRPSTIDAIRTAIASQGHRVTFLAGDATLPATILQTKPDICFNITEGMYGDAREAQVPALLELLRIPYTASRVLTNAISLDKVMTKRIWQNFGLPTAPFQVFVQGDEVRDAALSFPLFVKPSREGSGMGMDAGSIVYNETELRARVNLIISRYHQPALVEPYLTGREFTVGVLGRKDAKMASRMPHWYAADGYVRLPILEIDSHQSATPGVYGNGNKILDVDDAQGAGLLCPAPISAEFNAQLQQLAIAAHEAVGALDISRVDIRLDAHGAPTLVEINTLPGIAPDFSDLMLIMNAAGMAYNDVVLEILYQAAYRYGLK
ncbi:MAG: hypothetical protein RL076_2379 [Chloroflexota bacterium]|jgi:D-alanine-D-alanine ligase